MVSFQISIFSPLPIKKKCPFTNKRTVFDDSFPKPRCLRRIDSLKKLSVFQVFIIEGL
jgi:hypothetical protein